MTFEVNGSCSVAGTQSISGGAGIPFWMLAIRWPRKTGATR